MLVVLRHRPPIGERTDRPGGDQPQPARGLRPEGRSVQPQPPRSGDHVQFAGVHRYVRPFDVGRHATRGPPAVVCHGRAQAQVANAQGGHKSCGRAARSISTARGALRFLCPLLRPFFILLEIKCPTPADCLKRSGFHWVDSAKFRSSLMGRCLYVRAANMRIAVLTFGILAVTGLLAGQVALRLDGPSIVRVLTRLLTHG
jgi:hypothetical protein